MKRVVLLFCFLTGIFLQSYGNQLTNLGFLGEYDKVSWHEDVRDAKGIRTINSPEGVWAEDLTGITFPNGTFAYDGTARSLAIEGVLPDGVTVTYLNNNKVNVGVYTVTAVINGGEEYNDLTLTATLTIEKADITGVALPDGTFDYDGTAKALAITGTIPSGVVLTYTNNSQTSPGIYTVTAHLNGGTNYNDLTLTATLTINCPAVNADDVYICPGSESATMEWLVNGANEWEVAVQTANTAAPNPDNIVTIGMPKYMPTNLLVNQTYYFYVRTKCEGGLTSSWTKISFRTSSVNIAESNPFCAGPEGIIFPNANNQDGSIKYPYGEGLRIACLSTVPYPIWYYLTIDEPGDLIFDILQYEEFDVDGNPVPGTGLDVDFVAFGPFSGLGQACEETELGPCPPGVPCGNNTTNPGNYPVPGTNIIDCSYSVYEFETLRIYDAQPGEIYAVLITNYKERPGFIKLVQTNTGQPGAGSTDCSFLYNIDLGPDLTVEDETALCPGATHLLDTELEASDYNFQWTKDGVDIVGANEPTYLVTETGLYGLKIVVKNTEADVYTNPGPILIEYFDSIILERELEDLVKCTGEGQGLIFNLQEAVEGLTFSPVVYEFYESASDAEAQTNALGDFYHMSSNASIKTVWVRVQSIDGNPCYKVLNFTLRKEICEVDIVPLNDLEVCADGAASFDLTVYNDIVFHGFPGYNITYHTSEEDAQSLTDAIPSELLTAYPGTHNEVIWVRVTKADDPTVYKYTSFKLLIRPVPVINPNLTPLYACASEGALVGDFQLGSKDNEIKQSASGLIVEYYESEAAAHAGDATAKLSSTSYISEAKTIYVRLYSPITGCYSVGELTLLLGEVPQLNDVSEIFACDDSGYYAFNLNVIAGEVIGLGAMEGVTYKFYRSYSDAQHKVNALTGSTYTNMSPWSDVIYLRVEDKVSKCDVIHSLGLKVNRKPALVSPSDLEVCDSGTTGVANFDLTSKESEFLNGLDSSLYHIYYYPTMALAQAGNADNRIENPSSYSNLTTNYVYVRVEDKATGCYSIVSIKLVVHPRPVVPATIADLKVCDDITNSGFAEFRLKDRADQLAGGNNDLTVSFHETQADAEHDMNALNQEGYLNITAHQQTIYVRVTDSHTGCFVIRTMRLVVNAYPIFTLEEEVVVCSSSNSSIGEFNLIAIAQSYIEGYLDYGFAFYETYANAVQELNHILDPESYNNVAQGTASVWIRIEHTETGCVGIYEIALRVNRSPLIPVNIPLLSVCDTYGNPHDSRAEIDLTVHEEYLTQHMGSAGYELIYYRTEAHALADEQALNDPTAYHNAMANETIWFRLINTDTGCYSIGHFDLEVKQGLILIRPDDISVCSDLSLGVNKYLFDLTIREDDILGGGPVFGVTISYYESESEALSGSNAIETPTAYLNTSAVQTIWVVAYRDNGCSSMTTLNLRVYATPEPNHSPSALELCEEEFESGTAHFNLEDSIADIISGDTHLAVSFYISEEDAHAEIGEIVAGDRVSYESESTIVYVRVENTLTGTDPKCYVIVELPLQVNPKPSIAVTPFVICMDNHPDHYLFNLEDKNAEILDGRSSEDYTVTYYLNEADATDGSEPLPYTYTNVDPESQEVWARIENVDTGCFNVAPLLLQIEEKVYATQIPNPEPYCDDNDDPNNPINDGYTRINLTEFSIAIIGEQTIPAGDLKVDYYASLEDYQNDEPIANPSQFVNTSNPQTIVAVVRNRDADLYCEDYITFEIMVHQRPEVLPIEGEYYLCTDYVSQTVTPVVIDSKMDSNRYEFVWWFDGEELEGEHKSYVEAIRPGVYTVGVIDKQTGCVSVNTADAVVQAVPPFTVVIEEGVGARDQMAQSGTQTIMVRVEDDNPTPPRVYEYALNDGDFGDSNVFYGVEAGDHVIWVRDKITGACTVSAVASVMDYPKYFTPNGDGFNDTWNILGLKNQPGAKIYIFDRYGKLLKQLSPLDVGWDGTFGGRPMPSTDYWFTVEYRDFQGNPREFKGHFSLKR